MYRIEDIYNGVKSLVGWEQHWDSSSEIDEELTVSESGLYYQQAHPLLTLDNMRAVMPSGWENGFDAYLEKVTKAGIVKAMQTFFSKKVDAKVSRNLLEHRSLFNGVGKYVDIIQNRGNFVGFEIEPVNSNGITVRLDRIGLQMKGATGTVRVYLFHSTQVEPVAYWDVEITRALGQFVWLDLGVSGPAIVTDDVPGAKWYLGYHQSQMPEWMDAINYGRDWSKAPCMQCNKGGQEEWVEMNRYFHVAPFMAPATLVGSDYDGSFDRSFVVSIEQSVLFWNEDDMVYTPNYNYGINFTYTVGCDLTDFVVRQRAVFAPVIQKQVAYDCLKTIALNPEVRVNRNQLNAAQLLADLDGEPGLKRGLAVDLERAYNALDIDTSGLDPVCLGCRNRGVRYGQA